MSEILVLYESKSGHTKTYAEWVAEDVHAICSSINNCKKEMIEQSDLIIFGGGVNGSLINGLSRFEKKVKQYQEKKIIYFAVGIRPPTTWTKELIKKNNFEKKEVECFYFQGGLDLERLTAGDRTLLKVYGAMLKRRNNIHEEDRAVLKLLCQNADYTTREQIQPLTKRVCEIFEKKGKGEKYEQKRSN